MINEKLKKYGIDSHYTNHSIRTASIREMYKSNIPESEIMNRSGHNSIKRIRSYKSKEKNTDINYFNRICINKRNHIEIEQSRKNISELKYSTFQNSTLNNCAIHISINK